MKRVEINAENPKVLVACYGTLRVGRGNWRALLEDRSTHMGTFRTEPVFTMHGKGCGFPVVRTKGKTAITYDLFEVTDKTVLNNLHSLEGCTGYPGHDRNWYDIQPIETPHGTAYMYVQHDAGNPTTIIESGDWDDK